MSAGPEDEVRDPGSSATTGERIPTRLADVTAVWLTGELQDHYPGVVVESLTVVDVVQGTTTKVRAEIQLNEVGMSAGIPRSVCMKANWTERYDRSLTSGICAYEGRFFRYMRPELELPAPEGYHGDHDDGTGQGFILMEDLVAAGASFGAADRPFSIDEAAEGLEGLAAIHASWWGDEKLARFPWLATSMAPGSRDAVPFAFRSNAFAEYGRRAERAAVLPEWAVERPERAETLLSSLVAHEEGLDEPRCLIHGDTHLGNSYRKPDGPLCWLDWQLARKGRPMRDVVYFLVGGLTIDNRRKAERELLRHYLEHLQARGVQPPDWADTWDEYRRWPIVGLIAWNGTEDGWQPQQVILLAIERFSAAIDDLDTVSLLM